MIYCTVVLKYIHGLFTDDKAIFTQSLLSSVLRNIDKIICQNVVHYLWSSNLLKTPMVFLHQAVSFMTKSNNLSHSNSSTWAQDSSNCLVQNCCQVKETSNTVTKNIKVSPGVHSSRWDYSLKVSSLVNLTSALCSCFNKRWHVCV